MVALVRRRPLTPVEKMSALVLASTVAAGYLYLGDPRLRLPFHPLFVILAIAAVERLRAWRTARRAPTPA